MAETPIRVRHLLKGLGPGGAERLVVTQLTAERSDRGPDYSVAYLLRPKDHLVAELERHGIPVHCLEAEATMRPGWVVRLRRLLRDDPTDIVHVHSPAVAAVVRLVARTIRSGSRPIVVGTEHNRWPRHHRLTRWANRATIGLQQATIAVSDDVRTTMGRRGRGVEVVVHGIDLAAVRGSADRDAARRDLGVEADDVLVVCVANLRREKALDVLIAAAAAAVRVEPRLRYTLIGQGPCSRSLADQVATSGLGSRFSMLGYRPDATRLMSGADIFTLSSRHEGTPVAVMEALALRLPVVATAAGGVPAAVGAAGVIVAVDDSDALAAAHVALAADPDRRSELARLAGAEADRFSAARATAAIETIYAATSADGAGARAASNHS